MIDAMHANPSAEIEDLLRRALTDRDRRPLDDLATWWDRAPALADRVAEAWLRTAIAALAAGGWRPVDVERALLSVASKTQSQLVAGLDDGVAAWRARHRLDGRLAAANVIGAGQTIRRLGRIPFVSDDASGGDVDAGVLAKVRALLAKAESTTFEAEAEALTAKAHQLMVRHTIDEALVAGRGGWR